MRTTSLQFITLTVGFCLLGCSGSDALNPDLGSGGEQGVGGATSGGGSTSTTGGSRAMGGSLQAGGAANAGGAATTGGAVTATGGNTPGTGGSPPTGGSKAAGGTPSLGGSKASGGVAANIGGSPATGGVATGGSKATGGMPVTGGTKATGGMPATGGTKATGGMPATGGTKATGGMPATGGSKATGGMAATGGTTTATTVTKFFGNITTGNSVDTGGMKYSKYWNQITPENAGKWGSVQSTAASAFNWGTLDAIYAYSNTNSIIFKQHTFVWGSQQPTGTAPTQAQVENWIKTFCARYPNTKLIDVVNEPPTHTTPNYTAALGVGETGSYPWIVKAFKYARQYCGSAILILNDYNNIEYSADETRFINIVKDIKANGAPIDAVGCQAHAAHSFSAATIQTNLNTMASQTGLPVYITEFDIPESTDSTQLSVMQALFPVFWNTAAVKGVTYWGWIEGQTWITGTGLVRGTTSRTAMTWLMGQLGRPVPPN